MKHPPLWSWQRTSLLAFVVLFIYCLSQLGFNFIHLPPNADPLEAAKRFFSAAFQPTLTDQNLSLPANAEPFLQRILKGILNTLRYAFIAMSMALPAGMFLGFFASKAWWPLQRKHDNSSIVPLLHTTLFFIRLTTRIGITCMRSIHELIWVLLFLAFLGDSPLTACIALALPFTGTLAKVFSEIIDEQNESTSKHILLAGGNHVQSFFAARLPQALPDLITYSMYRLECAIRSSAVLGFIGIETIGLNIYQSYENTYYNEVWTELYLLIITIICFDALGAFIRKRVHQAAHTHDSPSSATLDTLRQTIPRWKSLPYIFATLTITVILSWFIGAPLNQYHSHLSRWERAQHFFHQLIPEPVRISHQWTDALPWYYDLWQSNGQLALQNTLLMASTAVLLAALVSHFIVPWASRNLSSAHPFNIQSYRTHPIATYGWKTLGFISRGLFLIARSIPEYILAFLLIGMLGAHAWPLIFALAIHNVGILGRLWSEINENHDHHTAKQVIVRGGTRIQSYLYGTLPTIHNKQLLFIFYRWETCVRESTILGMVSLSSLGYYIRQEAAFLRYDSMLFYILLGTAVIFLSDIVSSALRAKLKTA